MTWFCKLASCTNISCDQLSKKVATLQPYISDFISKNAIVKQRCRFVLKEIDPFEHFFICEHIEFSVSNTSTTIPLIEKKLTCQNSLYMIGARGKWKVICVPSHIKNAPFVNFYHNISFVWFEQNTGLFSYWSHVWLHWLWKSSFLII
jgi:hypothetical protein